MKLIYLETSQQGMAWMRSYYRKNPQLNRKQALQALVQAEADILELPVSAERYEDFPNVREKNIHKTGPVAELCRSFNRILCTKGEYTWDRNLHQNLDKKLCVLH